MHGLRNTALRSLLAVMLFLVGCSGNEHPTLNAERSPRRIAPPENLVKAMRAVEPFFAPMGKPDELDWLATYREKGQTFEEYINEDPTVPTAERSVIYVLPLGKFTGIQTRVVDAASSYLGAFYGLSVKTLPARRIDEKLNVGDYRLGSNSKRRQIRTGYILDQVLRPMLPSNAAALIAFTDEDLYPDPSMNYVFGQASLENRVGVWSLFRLDDNANNYTFLRRTLKITVHETGHMFGMRHCTKYECVMSGTNHLGETDRRPIDACPECMAKICWMTKTEPRVRYERLAEFCRRNRLTAEASEFTRLAAAL